MATLKELESAFKMLARGVEKNEVRHSWVGTKMYSNNSKKDMEDLHAMLINKKATRIRWMWLGVYIIMSTQILIFIYILFFR